MELDHVVCVEYRQGALGVNLIRQL